MIEDRDKVAYRQATYKTKKCTKCGEVWNVSKHSTRDPYICPKCSFAREFTMEPR